MGTHIMKTTIEIADDLFERAQRLAKREKMTFRALTEEGLRQVLRDKEKRRNKLKPLPTVNGGGLTDEFKNASWQEILDESYRGRGT
jgi:hypothetical protein